MELRAQPTIPAPVQIATAEPLTTDAAPSRNLQAVRTRVCPVCGEAGVPGGAFRHPQCENLISVPQQPQGAVHGRYRELVAAVEQREAAEGAKRRTGITSRPVRIPQAREAVLGRSEGLCENPRCAGQPDDVKDNGDPILEVDHIEDLAVGGRDHPSQMIALCPNCHMIKTHGRTREHLRRVLADVARARHTAQMGC
ncbi:HNH endonuclease [Streptomyces vinaceus]|uniref:HNH endonuclease n=1 Tax=Streptomyces vinaceus TaxID=1960 RepID=UPI00368D3824